MYRLIVRLQNANLTLMCFTKLEFLLKIIVFFEMHMYTSFLEISLPTRLESFLINKHLSVCTLVETISTRFYRLLEEIK